MRRVALFMICALAVAGCSHADRVFLGHWEGGFDVASATPGANVSALKMKGYVHIYLNENKYTLELSNQLQVMDVEGHWVRIGPKRIELQPHSIAFTEPELDSLKAMRRPILDPVNLRAVYGKPLIFDVDGDTITGLLITVGPMTGRHVFRRGI